jgi:hypothetical protein
MIVYEFSETIPAPMRFLPVFSLSGREKARQNLSLNSEERATGARR